MAVCLARFGLMCFVLVILIPSVAQSESPLETILNHSIRTIVRDAMRQPESSRAITIPSDAQLSKIQAKRLQSALATLGYYSGAIDGAVGRDTLIAVGRWAAERGWDAPNTIRTSHLDYLEKEVAERGGQTIATDDARGSQDVVVRRVQSALGRLGYYSGSVDGRADSATMAALAAWAADRGWSAPTTIRPGHADYMEKESPSQVGESNTIDPDARTVSRVQTSLKRLGYYAGLADGKATATTLSALAAWAADRGWSAPLEVRAAHADNMERELQSGGVKVASGNGPLIDETLTWQADDISESYIRRVRAASKTLGGTCDDERASLKALASGMAWDVAGPQKARVGQTQQVDWAGNSLSRRIPAWLVISADGPVRFSGRGHMALGPDSPNPFGIAFGRGSTRAMISLQSRGAGRSGAVVFRPLRAEPLKLTISLVGYLRQCEEEIVLKSSTVSYNVEPANATVVLDTDAARAVYTHAIDVPRLGRRLLLNDTSFLLLDRDRDTEIVRRGGNDLSISPTHRFLTVRQGETREVIDLIDGATVAKIHEGAVLWALGDSVVFETHAPWAKVSLQSTFGDMLRVDNNSTGPACCEARAGDTRVGIDLHNAIYRIEGNYREKVGSLQQPALATDGTQEGGYGADPADPDASRAFVASLGLVAPIATDKMYDVDGGFSPKRAVDVDAGSAQAAPTFEQGLTKRLEEVGLMAARRETVAAANAPDANLTTDLSFQLDRIGIELAPMAAGETLFQLADMSETFSLSMDSRLRASKTAMNRFKSEAAAAGWRFDWALPIGSEGSNGDCEHLLMEELNGAEAPLAPRDVVNVQRIETQRGPVWVARADCTAGATMGSLRHYLAIYFMDLSGPGPTRSDSLLTAGAFLFENNQQEDWWYQHPTRIKADNSHLVTFAPGEGVITVWDRNTRKFLWIGQDLPDGNLLVDAFLTADKRHAVQLNADGSFRIHALADGQQTLSGRLVDDEIAVWTNDNHYDATAEAASMIDIRFPGKPETFSLDRFGTTRAVPGLARNILANGIFPSPGEELDVPPDLSGTVALDTSGDIGAQLSFDLAKVSALSVFQDGALTDTLAGANLRGSFSVRRFGNARWVSIVATDKGGLASLPISADLGRARTASGLNRLFAVGVNSYQSDKGLAPLNFPLRDAGTIIDTLATSPGGDAEGFEMRGLRDRQATPETILDGARGVLDGLVEGDHAVFFLAGHGLRGEDGQFYFATANTDAENLAGTALPFARLTELLSTSRARITVLLDTCHSGLAGQGLFATNDQLANGLQVLKSNITVVAAAKGRQESLGSVDAGGGHFTQAFRRIVKDERGRFDRDKNGRIEVDELFAGLRTLVSVESGGSQSPWIVKSRMVGNYALF